MFQACSGPKSRAVASQVLRGRALLMSCENKYKTLKWMNKLHEPQPVQQVKNTAHSYFTNYFQLIKRAALIQFSSIHLFDKLKPTWPDTYLTSAWKAAALLAVYAGHASTCCSAPTLCSHRSAATVVPLRKLLTLTHFHRSGQRSCCTILTLGQMLCKVTFSVTILYL